MRRLDDPGHEVEATLLEEDGAIRQVFPVTLAEDPREPIAMHRLDDQRRVGPEHPPELAEHRQIPVVAPVADRAEEVERAVELPVGEGKLAQVAFDEDGIVPRAGPGPRRLQLICRQVDANHVVAGVGERDRVATEAAGRIEHAGAGSDAGERHRGERLVPGGLVRELRAVRLQVVAIEETAPPVGGRRHAFSFSRRRSLTTFGFALPSVAFIT